jgi:hypothetical protein
MNFFNLSTSVKFQYLFIYLIASIYLVLISLQGFDLCDEGWVLSAFQQIYQAPESVSYYFLYYLNALIGGIFYYFFENGGILSFRLLNAALILAIFYVLQKIFESYLTPFLFVITVMFSFLISDFGAIILDHNHLSAFLILSAVLFIFKSKTEVELYKIIFAGFLIGLSFFARLPNLTMMILIVLFLIDYFYFRNFNILLKKIMFFFGGVAISILCMLLLMKLLNHDDIYIKNVSENVWHGAVDPNHNHSIGLMFKSYFNHWFGMLKFALITFLIIGSFATINHFFKSKIFLLLSYFIVFIIFLYFEFADDLLNFSTLLLIPLICSIFIDYKNREILILNTAALLIFIFFPWGSDEGAYNMGVTSLFLLVLLSSFHVYRSIKNVSFNKYRPFITLFTIVVFTFIPIRIYRIYHTAYFDFGPRTEKIYKINHLLANTYTTKKKSLIMNDLLNVLAKEIKPNEVVYIHESMPMLHFLTKTKPYLDNSWPWIYGPENFNQRLLNKEKESGFRPTIIRQKCQPIGGAWTTFDKNYDDTILPLSFSYNAKRTLYFKQFLHRNKYQVTWENELFQILKIKK